MLMRGSIRVTRGEVLYVTEMSHWPDALTTETLTSFTFRFNPKLGSSLMRIRLCWMPHSFLLPPRRRPAWYELNHDEHSHLHLCG